MEELLKYIHNNSFSDKEIQELQTYLLDEESVHLFDRYLKEKYKYLTTDEINNIINFIEKLPKINKSPNWQIAIRVFCETLIEKTIGNIIVIPKEDLPYLDIIKRIFDESRKVILSPISYPINEEERKKILNIIKRNTTFFIMSDEKEYSIAINILKELGITETELKELSKIKKEQLKRENTTKRRT